MTCLKCQASVIIFTITSGSLEYPLLGRYYYFALQENPRNHIRLHSLKVTGAQTRAWVTLRTVLLPTTLDKLGSPTPP